MMTKRSLIGFLAAGCLLLEAAPHIGYLYPAGARAGTLVEVLVGGQALWGIGEVRVTGGGVTCEGIDGIGGYPYPYERQRRYIVECLKARLENRPMPAKPDTREGWRPNACYDRIIDLAPRAFDLAIYEFFVRTDTLQLNPSIQHKILLRLRVAPDAKPGRRELRLCRNGVGEASNPLPFFITKVPEITEEPYRMPPAKAPPTAFQAPCVLNGQIRPGECDRFTFTAQKGEFLSFRATARSLYPFQGDCVPGHTQLVLEIFDAGGRSVAFADDDAFRPDPVLEHRFAKSGKYTLAVRDALYRGRDDFTYRIAVSREKRQIAPQPPAGNRLPVVSEKAVAAVINKPVLISGMLQKRHARSFRFLARKGERLAVEVWARRLGSPLDPVLTISDPKGKVLHQVDDTTRIRIGENLQRSADPYCGFSPPETGEYLATVSDIAGAGGYYYLRIDRPHPDFHLYTAPSCLTATNPTGSSYLFRVEPLDGFRGEIRLKVEGEAAKLYEFGDVDSIPAGASEAWLTLKPKRGTPWHKLRTVIPARISGRYGALTRSVIPCHSDMQAFAYTHWLPVEELLMGCNWGSHWENGFSWHEKSPKKFRLKPGESATLQVKILRKAPPSGFRKMKLICLNPRGDLKMEAVELPGVPAAVRVTRLPPAPATAKMPEAENLLFQFTGEYDSAPDRKGKVRSVTVSFHLEVVQVLLPR